MFDTNEYERIVREWSLRMYEYCRYRLAEYGDFADDTVNEVFLTLYKKWDEAPINGNIGAYLYRTADNCVRNQIKKQRRYDKRIFRSGETDVEENAGMTFDEYFANDGFSERSGMVYVYNKLPDEYKTLFKLRYVDKLKLEDITAQTDIKYSALRLRLFKMEPIIKKYIKEYCEKYGGIQ